MGVCHSSESLTPEQKAEQAANKAVEDNLAAAREQSNQIHKLLLLGTGASGKSTLFKQAMNIYGGGISESERKGFTSIIHSNITQAMRVLSGCLTENEQFSNLSSEVQSSCKLLAEERKELDDQLITSETAAHMKAIWDDPTVQAIFSQMPTNILPESLTYFMSRLTAISSPTYIPSVDDMLRARAPTTGIVEQKFAIDGNQFMLFDVGGQRNERKKWIHCFENVTAVLFVASLSEYNQTLYEDSTTNRLEESLSLFSDIAANKFLQETSLILFLNKRDLLPLSLEKSPFKNYFPQYTGENQYDEVLEYIEAEFMSRSRGRKRASEANVDVSGGENKIGDIYVHVTCATDSHNAQVVFASVKDIVIRRNLARVGLL